MSIHIFFYADVRTLLLCERHVFSTTLLAFLHVYNGVGKVITFERPYKGRTNIYVKL